jgi:hypothetical protein
MKEQTFPAENKREIYQLRTGKPTVLLSRMVRRTDCQDAL